LLLRLDLPAHPTHSPTTMLNITPTQLRKAADIQERIQSLQSELNEILGVEVPTPGKAEAPKKKWKFSAAARAKMRRAQKARWAKIKGTAPETEPTKKGKRKMSAQGIANIRAGVAKRMAAQGKALAAKPSKKTKKKFSAAARAAISAASKARWAKAKAQGKTTL
jgi:hypothetical protein